MRLLLDTHALLWWWQDSPKLSDRARAAMADPTQAVWVSVASVWEMSIKQQQGKLSGVPTDVRQLAALLTRSGFDLLPIGPAHALRAGNHPSAHRDPFDRMLAAQAELEDATLVTRDPAFEGFGVRVLW